MASVDGVLSPPRASLTAARWIGFSTIVIREYGRIVRIWSQTLLPSAVTTILYFVIFANLLGRRIGVIDGVDYRQFIAPGLIMMQVVQNSYGNVVSSFFGAKFGKHIEELLVSPLPNWIIVAGYAAGGVLRGVLVGIVVSIVALLFTRVQIEHPWAVLAATVLAATVFALAGFINAIFARNFDQVNWIPTFILTPLSYFGGVFYAVSMLPGWAQRVSLGNPILYMVNAARYGFLGISDVPVIYAFPFMLLLAAVLFLVAVALLARGVGTRD
jgi:ABC-2 type transport system permease protein